MVKRWDNHYDSPCIYFFIHLRVHSIDTLFYNFKFLVKINYIQQLKTQTVAEWIRERSLLLNDLDEYTDPLRTVESAERNQCHIPKTFSSLVN